MGGKQSKQNAKNLADWEADGFGIDTLAEMRSTHTRSERPLSENTYKSETSKRNSIRSQQQISGHFLGIGNQSENNSQLGSFAYTEDGDPSEPSMKYKAVSPSRKIDRQRQVSKDVKKYVDKLNKEAIRK